MAFKPFDAKTLAVLDDGVVAAMLNAHIRRAAQDCADRPGDVKPRLITLTIGIVPVPDQSGVADKAAAQCAVKSKMPDHKSRPVSLILKPNGNLLFNPDSLENVDQGTLLGDDD